MKLNRHHQHHYYQKDPEWIRVWPQHQGKTIRSTLCINFDYDLIYIIQPSKLINIRLAIILTFFNVSVYSERETDSDSNAEQSTLASVRRSANFSKRNYRQRSQSDSPQSNHGLETMESETENDIENENESTDESDSESSEVVKLIWFVKQFN